MFAQLVVAAAAALGDLDAHVFLLPLLRDLLAHDFLWGNSFTKDNVNMMMIAPIDRQTFNTALSSSLRAYNAQQGLFGATLELFIIKCFN